ncbi:MULTISPECIES: adenylate/guanylate cyclase domain-containing protein [unclassified Limnothrix]|uniref:adenylate/guanylate cyclase domain-containing protein n=1 Tax=unclassified Limnothrix TaxID=2632864 RepID=UPI00081DE8AC|nr:MULTISPECIES: adenylate/guanylate cyclase domain-containing protein [unclassified Limnothrix]OCQ90776.1 adenylate cyclase [Limnothrix sp. P13C2]PIB14279.1 adenylate cyclase [Limnothrix sp. PR1529]
MAEIQLRLQVPGSPDRLIPVETDSVTIGRASDCELPLSPYGVSRHHARISRADRASPWMVEDLQSKNGTRLNQTPLQQPTPIAHGDRIYIENVCITVLLAGVGTTNAVANPTITRSRQSPQGPKAVYSQRVQVPLNPEALPPTVSVVRPNLVKLPLIDATADGKMRISRDASDLKEQWLRTSEGSGDSLYERDRTIARLRDLVEIAKGLTSAASSNAIFSQVQEVVFRYLTNIERLALLVDVEGNGQLQLLNAAARETERARDLTLNSGWISQSICQKVFKEKIALQTADAQADERFGAEQSILYKGIRSAMAVPLWNEDKVVGVLYADANLSSESWVQEGEDDLSFFSALANLVAASVQRWLLTRKLQEEERLCQKLERYHSPAVVQQMIAAGTHEDGRIPTTDGELSILFADIVGFTALSERLSPAEVADLLNRFFEEMLQEVFALGGTLDKFIGDCIMAFFGAPEPQPDHADRAVIAARRMLERLDDLNKRNVLGEHLQLRIAINSGRAVVGDVGSSQRMDYTVLGGAVNLAARMEAICPVGQCIISANTYDLVSRKMNWVQMGEFRFKGIERPVPIFQDGHRAQELELVKLLTEPS